MTMRFRTGAAVLAAAALALAAPPATARDGDPAAPPAAPAAPDAAQLLRQMQELYPKALHRPAAARPGASKEEVAAAVKGEAEWDTAVRALAKAGDDYTTALNGAAADPLALFYRGAGKVLLSERVATAQAPELFKAAAESLTAYLGATKEDAAFRAEAEARLGRALLGLAASDPSRLDAAVEHLGAAVRLFQKDNRRDEAGEAAWIALSALRGPEHSAALRAFADAVHAKDADFGASTPTIRTLAAGAAVAVGSPLPALPDVQGVDGKPLGLNERGSPMLLHFFQTGLPNGHASSFRDVETDVRPLWERWHDKGLRVVGISMDYEIPAKKAEEMRRKWKEDWGIKEEFHDGSLESCRAWCASKGVLWPWYWDGRWSNNPVSRALGGVGVSASWAVLVDKDGIVRWLGAPPYAGLADEVAKWVPAGK